MRNNAASASQRASIADASRHDASGIDAAMLDERRRSYVLHSSCWPAFGNGARRILRMKRVLVPVVGVQSADAVVALAGRPSWRLGAAGWPSRYGHGDCVSSPAHIASMRNVRLAYRRPLINGGRRRVIICRPARHVPERRCNYRSTKQTP